MIFSFFFRDKVKNQKLWQNIPILCNEQNGR